MGDDMADRLSQFNDEALDELGFAEYSAEDRARISVLLSDRLRDRVGEELSQGVPDAEMADFGALMDKDLAFMRQWFYAYDRDYRDSQAFRDYAVQHLGESEADILSGYGMLRWLELHRPDYRQVVAEVTEDIKQAMMNLNSI